jgi:small Trp-rich protein
MWIFVIGLVILAMKLADFGFAADWSWWWVLSPFALTVLWWELSDRSGLTSRRAERRMEARKARRRQLAIQRLRPQRELPNRLID